MTDTNSSTIRSKLNYPEKKLDLSKVTGKILSRIVHIATGGEDRTALAVIDTCSNSNAIKIA
jgi:hypothetical protein